MKNRLFKLSPSDFAFLYEGCKRCFYLKITHNISQPSMPLPGIFSKIAALLKNHYDGLRTEKLHPALSPGVIKYGEKFVRSKPIEFPDRQSSCYINGRFDIVVKFDDGSYGVIDFKTGSPRKEHSNLYGRQLHAYAYALENPEENALSLSPVTKLGLLYFHPQNTLQKENEVEKLLYEADVRWMEINKDQNSFLNFVKEMVKVLELTSLPKPTPDCIWCKYQKNLVELGQTIKTKQSS